MNSAALTRRNNCFNLIRMLGALQVFFGHACTHLELPMPSWLMPVWSIFRGVPIFFMLSGFLLWGSLQRNSSLKTYCRKRIARLYPELWGGVAVNAAVMVIVLGGSIALLPFIAHILAQATVFQFWTPASLRVYGCGTPNGSLWTVGVMVQCYIVLYFAYRLLQKKSLKVQLMALSIAVGCNFLPLLTNRLLPNVLSKLFLQTFVPYFWLFLAGGLVCAFFDQIITHLKRWWLIYFSASACISVLGFEDGFGAYGLLQSLSLGAAIVGFAYRFPKLEIKSDYSYGFFIYHMIVINLMNHFGFVGKFWYMAIALIGSFACAVASTHIAGLFRRK